MIIPKVLVTSLAVSVLLISVPSCGFQLRGSPLAMDQNQNRTHSMTTHAVRLQLKDKYNSAIIRHELSQELKTLGVTVNDASDDALTPSSKQPSRQSIKKPASKNNWIDNIAIENVTFRKYELVGVLTEVRIVMTADVTYQVWQEGVLKSHHQPLQLERSYQYNQASVSFEDKQSERIKYWLYENLAKRVSAQYVALSQ